jgi:hypothetical protein
MLVRRLILVAVAVSLCSALVSAMPAGAAWEIRDIAFPVEGDVRFSDDFGDPRYGHSHEGNDLMGKKMQPLLAAVDGRVRSIEYPEASWGYAIVLEDADNYRYHYLHVNNDTPGTDDGAGGPENAYAPGIYERAYVRKGQLIGWMGDSGNAESAGPHLHFEIRRPDRTAINPYESLLAASKSGTFDPAAALAAYADINADRVLLTNPDSTCVSGSRVKTASSKAVYYCGADGKRYVFPNDKTYYSWYKDFTGVTTISDAALAALRLGGNVTYRPGSRLVKITTDPKVYAVDHNGTLRHVTTAEVAASLYGADWAKKVDDLSDAFFINYKVGEPITRSL